MSDEQARAWRVAAALRRLAAVSSDEDVPDAELDAALEVAFRTPGVREELLRRAGLQGERFETDDDRPEA